ncbi:MAG TPA: hypothetical protein VF862_00270 [Gemmatimonadales bacterium]
MRSSLAIVLACVAALAACGDDGPDPQPKPVAGEVTMVLATPFVGQDGGMVVRVIGAVDTITALGGHALSFVRQGNITRVVVTGNLEAGDLLRIKVPDLSQVGAYSAFVEQAAARNSYVLLDVSGYGLTLRGP